MSLANHVSLTITRDTVGPSNAGFGVPLILGYNAAFSERYRLYADMTEVVVDFAATTVEYMAAQTILSQSPKPEQVMIGRGALPPTLVYTGGVESVIDSHAYTVTVVGETFSGTATFTSGVGTTNDLIVAGIVAALNAISGNNFLAAVVVGVGDTDTFTVTADAAGDWVSLEVDPAELSLAMTHVDPGVATDLAAIELQTSAGETNWYGLYTLYNSEPYTSAASAWIEAQRKIYAADSSDTTSVTVTAGDGDALDELHTNTLARSAGFYHPSPADFLGAAALGLFLPQEPGSATLKYKTPAGVAGVVVTSTHRTNLRSKEANTVQRVAGVNFIWEGTTADGDFLDVTRDLDWLDDDMRVAVFAMLLQASKVPFTDKGIAMVEAQIRASLDRAVAREIITPDYTVTVPLASAVTTANKAARILPDIKWSATLAGAVHKVDIDGVVSL
jgi:hypothetical protein